ncbi:Ferric reduction oxidase 5 [Choanephora cucurbitarum]|uniref:ferric-chelate reductase (NADPH) n=1 Tax=Choanephora cucurbitarum TaxID=101091 RepID=A0A1C7N850_9FUNG|nr:Ferric reduction oxidase 5 [Choanephora cucurbitarum]
MDMNHMSSDARSQDTSFNMNLEYANNLLVIISAVIAFLTVRYACTRIYHHQTNKQLPTESAQSIFTPIALTYGKLERIVVNKFSYTIPFRSCPPLGAILIFLALFSAVLPLLLLNTDYKLNSNRAGFISLALVPFLLGSTGKNSALSFLTGVSTIKLNFLHRILGLALFICATLHMACMIGAWSKFPTFMASQLHASKVQYGIGAYACLCVVFVGSLWPVRVFSYEIFLGTHLTAFGFIGAVAVHTPFAMRYFIAGLVCYILNLCAVWFVKTYVADARFEVLPGSCTKVAIRLSSPMRAHYIGQHINLCIPAISPFQWHPFTIASIFHTDSALQDTLEVCVVARGNFTRQLYEKVDSVQQLRVFVSGPFGSTQVRPAQLLQSHRSIVIVSGGAGITFGMRVLRDLTQTLVQANQEKNMVHSWTTQEIRFYWSVRNPLELEWFLEELEKINYIYANTKRFPQLHIQLHVTSKAQNHSDESVASTALGTTSAQCKNVQNISCDIIEQVSTGGSRKEFFEEECKKEVKIIRGQRIDAASCLPTEAEIGVFGMSHHRFQRAVHLINLSLSS